MNFFYCNYKRSFLVLLFLVLPLLSLEAKKYTKFWGNNKKAIPEEKFRYTREITRMYAPAFSFSNGERLGFWDFRVTLNRLQDLRYYLQPHAEHFKFLIDCISSDDRLVNNWGFEFYGKIIPLLDRSVWKELHEEFLKNLFVLLQEDKIRQNWVLFDFMRSKGFLENVALRTVFARDPWFRAASFEKDSQYSLEDILKRLKSDPQLIGDPDIFFFLSENRNKLNELYKKEDPLSEEMWQQVDQEMAYFRGEYQWFITRSLHMKPDSRFVSYGLYSQLARHDYFNPVALGVDGFDESENSFENQMILTWEFIDRFKFHPGRNDALFRYARMLEEKGRYLDAIKVYLILENLYDPYDGMVFTARAFLRLNYLLHNVIPLVDVLYLEKSSKDLRVRALASIAAANRFYLQGKFTRALRKYKTSQQLVQLLYQQAPEAFGRDYYSTLQNDISTNIRFIRRIYPNFIRSLRNDLEGYESRMWLGKKFYKAGGWLKLPGYKVHKMVPFFGYFSPGYISQDMFFFMSTGYYMAWQNFYRASSLKLGSGRQAEALFFSANCALRLGQSRFQLNPETRYNKKYWKDIARKGYQMTISLGKNSTYGLKSRKLLNSFGK